MRLRYRKGGEEIEKVVEMGGWKRCGDSDGDGDWWR